MSLQFKIGNTKIGAGHAMVIAEISANHNHEFKKAVTLIRKAKECGVDAVKFQTYTPDTLTIDCRNKYFQVKHPRWRGQTLYELYEKAYTKWEWFKKLKKAAEDLGLLFFATAFDKASVDFLEELGVKLHKISSFELVDLPLIEYAARTKKPIILSTGMATVREIKEAVDTARRAGAKKIVLLKCVNSYPAKPEQMNLMTIPDLKKRFDCPVGLSDHSLGIGAAVCAVALGADVIEKHFILSREKDKTPDNFFSIEPQELKELVENVRIAEKALGKAQYQLTGDEKESKIYRRSLFVVKDIKKGQVFSSENIKSIRPAYGLEPKYMATILGKKAKRNIKKGTPLSRGLIVS